MRYRAPQLFCTVPGCSAPRRAVGMCRSHYMRAYHQTNAEQERRYRKTHYEENRDTLISRPCFYCNGPLNPTGSGLDRRDSSIGYVLDNVVPRCRACNVIKSDLITSEEMLRVAELLKSLRGSKSLWEEVKK